MNWSTRTNFVMPIESLNRSVDVEQVPVSNWEDSSNLLVKDGFWKPYWELTKPRLSVLSIITAIVGYLCAQQSHEWLLFVAFLFGTCLCAGSAGALNQWFEWKTDSLMVRTQGRPIPSGIISPKSSLLYGLILGIIGFFSLFFVVNYLSALIAFTTIFSYVLIYTPLKKLTHWCTEIGAIPGALPPLIGWSAATGSTGVLGWLLFAILLAWQIPHFMALAWTFRNDYKVGGYRMVPLIDPTGTFTAGRALFFALILLPISLAPYWFSETSWLYGSVAFVMGVWYCKKSWQFYSSIEKERTAKSLFICSIIYLPVVLLALVVDRCYF